MFIAHTTHVKIYNSRDMTGIFKAEVPYHLDDFNEIGYNRIFFLFKRSNNGFFCLFVCLQRISTAS